MTYIALARKWRPRTFSELLGQDHINQALINSLDQNRLHHAYLFTGTRGVGKTSIARLFAKSLNCEQGIRAIPCLQCSNCISIEQGRFIDLIEVDGASRTRVEDTRELMENIQYVPSMGRFKIYLIDEVHMLSQHSFNALLKTLEEPPAHVKFLLATTDPQKLPVTVLSRCLQFNLKNCAQETILGHLQTILNEEHIDFEMDALTLIAKAARGSVRDALSLLDQTIVACNGRLLTDTIKQLLGYSQQDYALQIIQALGRFDPQGLLTISKQIAAEGGPFQYVIDELLLYFHQLTIFQNIPNHHTFITNTTELSTLANLLSPEDVQLFYQIAIKNQEEMHLSPSLAIAFDMMLLRMLTFRPAQQAKMPLLAYETQQAMDSLPHPLNKEHPSEELSPTLIASRERQHTQWIDILPQLKLTGLTLSAAENAEWIEKNENRITLRIEKGHKSVFTSSVIKRLEQALSDYYQEPIQLILESMSSQTTTPALEKRILKEVNHQQAEAALQADPFFQRLQQEFSAEWVKTSIEPLKDSL